MLYERVPSQFAIVKKETATKNTKWKIKKVTLYSSSLPLSVKNFTSKVICQAWIDILSYGDIESIEVNILRKKVKTKNAEAQKENKNSKLESVRLSVCPGVSRGIRTRGWKQLAYVWCAPNGNKDKNNVRETLAFPFWMLFPRTSSSSRDTVETQSLLRCCLSKRR